MSEINSFPTAHPSKAIGESSASAALPDISNAAAVFVHGHRLAPIEDGWLLVFDHNRSTPASNHHGQLCVVRTADGRTLARIIEPGSRPGLWTLSTVTGAPEPDVVLEWAEAVTMIVPRRPHGPISSDRAEAN